MPSPNANQKAKDNHPKIDRDDVPVTDPERSHRLALKTTSGPLMTRAMSQEDAETLDLLIRKVAPSDSPIIDVGLPDGGWSLNTSHVTAWQIIPNVFPKLT